MHALIIEDEWFIVDAVEVALRQIGYLSFADAGSVREAIAAAQKQCPDLIIANHRLIDGRQRRRSRDLLGPGSPGRVRHRQWPGGKIRSSRCHCREQTLWVYRAAPRGRLRSTLRQCV